MDNFLNLSLSHLLNINKVYLVINSKFETSFTRALYFYHFKNDWMLPLTLIIKYHQILEITFQQFQPENYKRLFIRQILIVRELLVFQYYCVVKIYVFLREQTLLSILQRSKVIGGEILVKGEGFVVEGTRRFWRSFLKTLNNLKSSGNELILYNSKIKKMQEPLLKHCKDTLKKNNLHPLKKLGKGAFSYVFSAQKIELTSPDNEIFSVKCINKKQFAKKPYLVKYIEQEIQSLRDLNHHHIVKLSRTFEDQGWIFIVMEFCDKGNIYAYQGSKEHGVVDFPESTHIVKSVLTGLSAIHIKNLIHRDIKAENILLLSDSTKTKPYGYTIKICDLGFCREDDENVNTFCGTTSYMAPEIFKKQIYDNKVDVWAVGVLFFRMLFGDFPFKSINMEYQISSKCSKGFNIKKMKLRHNPSVGKDTFEQLAEVFNKIFKINPEQRISVDELHKHKFFAPIKSMASISTESQSSSGDQEANFEAEKILFIESILGKVKILKFLTPWEQLCLDYYTKKISLTLLEPHCQHESYNTKHKEIKQSVDKLGTFLIKNMRQNNIPKLNDYFSHKATKFADFKQAYRLVVGHVFSKAHKQISQNISLRSQIKLQLFCCHLINRIFQKQYRKQIFGHYFMWLKMSYKQRKFSFNTFREWIKSENSDKLVQTVETMNEKFYKKK